LQLPTVYLLIFLPVSILISLHPPQSITADYFVFLPFCYLMVPFFILFLFFSLIQVVRWFSWGFGRGVAGDGIVTSGGPCWVVVGIRIGGVGPGCCWVVVGVRIGGLGPGWCWVIDAIGIGGIGPGWCWVIDAIGIGDGGPGWCWVIDAIGIGGIGPGWCWVIDAIGIGGGGPGWCWDFVGIGIGGGGPFCHRKGQSR
jgi:hypothetical protein